MGGSSRGAAESRILVAIGFLRNSYTDAPEKQLLLREVCHSF